MKWSLILLVSLGLLAAVSTSVLVGALRAAPSSAHAKGSSSSVEVVLATKPLPAMSAITPNDITVKVVPSEGLSEGYLSDPVQAIGRILVIPLVQDQIVTKTCFVGEGDRAKLAAAIPHGMRAISIMFPSHAVTGGLLYPGCAVDILAAFRLPSRDRLRGKAISTTLLQGIQVLAVEDVSIITKEEDQKQVDRSSYSGSKKVMVTLMVNSKQAEALQLAREYGSVSVAMRNPLDKRPVNNNATVLSEGQLAKSGSLMTPAVLSSEERLALLKGVSKSTKNSTLENYDPLADLDEQSESSSNGWNVTVIRGNDVQVQVLGNSETE